MSHKKGRNESQKEVTERRHRKASQKGVTERRHRKVSQKEVTKMRSQKEVTERCHRSVTEETMGMGRECTRTALGFLGSHGNGWNEQGIHREYRNPQGIQ